MTLFYFDVVSPAGREQDDLGISLADADAAYLEARRGVMEISRELLFGKVKADPAGYRFEIFDQDRRLVLEVPFREVLMPGSAAASRPMEAIRDSLHRNMARARELKAGISAELERARLSTSGMLDRLAKSTTD